MPSQPVYPWCSPFKPGWSHVRPYSRTLGCGRAVLARRRADAPGECHMLRLLTTSRESGRFFLGASVFALILLVACLFVLVAGTAEILRVQGAPWTSSRAVSPLGAVPASVCPTIGDGR